MTRVRTTPVNITVIEDRITSFTLAIEYHADGTINQQNTRFGYFVDNMNSDGEVVDTRGRGVNMEDWPAALKADIKTLYDRILIDAENQGLIGPGTDTDDLA